MVDCWLVLPCWSMMVNLMTVDAGWWFVHASSGAREPYITMIHDHWLYGSGVVYGRWSFSSMEWRRNGTPNSKAALPPLVNLCYRFRWWCIPTQALEQLAAFPPKTREWILHPSSGITLSVEIPLSPQQIITSRWCCRLQPIPVGYEIWVISMRYPRVTAGAWNAWGTMAGSSAATRRMRDW